MFTRCSEDAVSGAQSQKLHVPCNINQSALLPLRSPALRCQARQEEIKICTKTPSFSAGIVYSPDIHKPPRSLNSTQGTNRHRSPGFCLLCFQEGHVHDHVALSSGAAEPRVPPELSTRTSKSRGFCPVSKMLSGKRGSSSTQAAPAGKPFAVPQGSLHCAFPHCVSDS